MRLAPISPTSAATAGAQPGRAAGRDLLHNRHRTGPRTDALTGATIPSSTYDRLSAPDPENPRERRMGALLVQKVHPSRAQCPPSSPVSGGTTERRGARLGSVRLAGVDRLPDTEPACLLRWLWMWPLDRNLATARRWLAARRVLSTLLLPISRITPSPCYVRSRTLQSQWHSLELPHIAAPSPSS